MFLFLFSKFENFSDVAKIDADGNVEIFCQEEDLIYDKNNCLVEHWHVERLLNQSELIKGIQVRIFPHTFEIFSITCSKFRILYN